jgi:hypothetical protein
MTNNKELTSTHFDNQKMENINNKQQTAVEWLFSETLGITLQLANKRISHRNWELQMVKLYEQAKEMDKIQKFHMFNCGRQYQLTGEGTFKQVYQETYGGGEQ